jgi:ATP-dependent DNA helicase DinG
MDYHFPFETIRPAQKRSLDFINGYWKEGYKTIILQLPVGVGKSPLALAASRICSEIPFGINELENDDFPKTGESTWLLTTQKVLQKQYEDEFRNRVASITGKTNYLCHGLGSDNSCDQGLKFQKRFGSNIKDILEELPDNEATRSVKIELKKQLDYGYSEIPCGNIEECTYKREFAKWLYSPLSITNVAFFMNLSYVASHNIGRYRRNLLIVDEAHLLDDEIVRFCSIEFSRAFVMEELRIKLPKFDTTKEMGEWVSQHMIPAIGEKKSVIDARIAMEVGSGLDVKALEKKVNQLESQLKKAISFSESDFDDWVICENEEGDQSAKPVSIGSIGPDLIFKYGRRHLLMSGTILDKELYCQQLGIDIEETAFYQEDSPFKPDNRLVVKKYAGGMGRKNQDTTMPNVINYIHELLERHKDEKGIIHTSSYQINNLIMKKVNNPRLVTHVSAKEREEILRKHFESNEPTVLVSPSMTTGVDLRDDAARWGVIVKVSFPYLGDARIKALFERSRKWYLWKTAQDVLQACGRIVRTQEDLGIMYILDGDFERVLREAGSFFPKWWLEALAKED